MLVYVIIIIKKKKISKNMNYKKLLDFMLQLLKAHTKMIC